VRQGGKVYTAIITYQNITGDPQILSVGNVKRLQVEAIVRGRIGLNPYPDGQQYQQKVLTRCSLARCLKGDRQMAQYIFPVAIIVLNIGAAVMYAINCDVRKVIYFMAAAVLNAAVTF
jgi:hypothetical protein